MPCSPNVNNILQEKPKRKYNKKGKSVVADNKEIQYNLRSKKD
jgi:hypothetical protein